ncbi:MAG: poly-gamma-glutamate synthase PgsB [Planctomycetota bacterium]
MLVVVAMATGLAALALVEAWWYRRLIHRIPIRIHVNGTRGKSSVTRLIAAGLRSGGVRTCAKTTGTLARMIFHDGREFPIFRPDRANVIEQKRVFRAAVSDQAEAIVIECMALQPLLQSVCELKLVHSTHGVITNARADHLDVMGPTRLDVASALSATTPIGGMLYTAEDRDDSLAIMGHACDDRNTCLQVVGPDVTSSVTQDELSQFSYLEHAENVALALKVCTDLGIPRKVALEGMWSAPPDPGAMRVHDQVIRGQRWHFINAFAANDPESTQRIWESAREHFPSPFQRVVVMNCRVDRADRSETMATSCSRWSGVDRYVIIGSGTDVFLRQLLSEGVSADQVLCLGDATGHEVVSALLEMDPFNSDAAILMGIGNMAGPGMRLADEFERSSGWESLRSPMTKTSTLEYAR